MCICLLIKLISFDLGFIVFLTGVNELTGIKESDTGLAPPALWDLAADKQALQVSVHCHSNYQIN